MTRLDDEELSDSAEAALDLAVGHDQRTSVATEIMEGGSHLGLASRVEHTRRGAWFALQLGRRHGVRLDRHFWVLVLLVVWSFGLTGALGGLAVARVWEWSTPAGVAP